jgi:Right handed beta helix region
MARGSQLALTLFILSFFAADMKANVVSVGCPGSSGTFDFTSVNAAVSSLAALGRHDHAIIISGTCTEVVQLDDWDNLRLVGTTGAGIFAPANPGGHIGIIEIQNSKRMGVSGLRLLGIGTGGPGPMFIKDSSVDVFQCTLENGGALAGGGMFVQGHSNVLIHASTIQNNSPAGIRIDGPATVQVGDVGTALEPVPTVVQGNDIGLQARASGIVGIHGKTIIQNNGVGVLVSGGQAVFCCDEGQRQVLNNQIGIFVLTGGKLETIGPVLVQGNQQLGIAIGGGSATIGAGNVVRQNGAGIQVRASSSLRLSSGAVTNNSRFGIAVRDNSSAIINDESISGNPDGIRVLILSSAAINGPGTVVGNTDADLTCSQDSLAYGDKTAIGKLSCPHFDIVRPQD